MTYTVLVTAPKLALAGLRVLEEAGCRVIFTSAQADGAEVEHLMRSHPVEAVISRTLTLSASAIEGCPALKVISKHGVGVSNIAMDAATRAGIPVYVTPGANAQSVAELSLGLMLAAARRIAWMDGELRAGRWSRAQDGMQLGGRTLGLVGLGQIGHCVARICGAMGMQVLAFDPAAREPVAGIEIVPTLERLLERADVLSLHVPLTEKTRRMIGREQLALLPKGAIVINTARGEVIDEEALVAALRAGHIAAAGLDTTEVEPLPPASPLLALPNVVLTPHVGGSTGAALDAMASGAADNVLRHLRGEAVDPRKCVNPQVLGLASPTSSLN